MDGTRLWIMGRGMYFEKSRFAGVTTCVLILGLLTGCGDSGSSSSSASQPGPGVVGIKEAFKMSAARGDNPRMFDEAVFKNASCVDAKYGEYKCEAIYEKWFPAGPNLGDFGGNFGTKITAVFGKDEQGRWRIKSDYKALDRWKLN